MQRMEVTVRFFASHREATGETTFRTDVPDGTTASGALDLLVERFPRLRPLRHNVVFAVNQTMVSAQTELHEGDELALLPPMAGG
jgi:molybdopterin converting factor subunit 1